MCKENDSELVMIRLCAKNNLLQLKVKMKDVYIYNKFITMFTTSKVGYYNEKKLINM